MSPDPTMDFSVSLGITPKEYAPEQILSLAEIIAQKQGKRIVVCIDEFQQIGEFPNSVTVQKRLRGAWQLQQNVSYCLFGSKKHLMTNMFQNKNMPFFQFGDVASDVHDGFLSKKVISLATPYSKCGSEELVCRNPIQTFISFLYIYKINNEVFYD